MNSTPLDNGALITTENTVFLELGMISDEEFASIRLRCMHNQWPTVMYDNGDFPVRKLSFWPVPASVQGVELWLWSPIDVYASLDEELDLPQGYERYLRYALAVELAAEFGKEIPNVVTAILTEAESNLKKLNQKIPIAKTSGLLDQISNKNKHWNYLDMIMGAGVPRKVART